MAAFTDFENTGENDTCDLHLDDIKIEFHPNSGKPAQIFHFDEYTSSSKTSLNNPIDSEPWKPLQSRLDFEIAELMLDTHMNRSQTNRLLSVIHQCIKTPAEFTLENSTDLENVWENAWIARISGVWNFVLSNNVI